MDDIEKEYFTKIKPFASDFDNRRKELADSRIKMFVATLCRNIFEYDQKFDLILGTGNSGLYMTKIAEITYQHLGLKVPQILNIPLFRFKKERDFNDNSGLFDFVQESLKTKATNIVFVDTEIMQGISAKEAMNLIIKTNPKLHRHLTIIAENHFFEWHYDIPQVSLSFFAYCPLIQGLNDNIAHFIPQDLFEEIKKVSDEEMAYNFAMAAVIGGGIKRMKEDGTGYFDTEILTKITSKIPGFKKRQAKLFEDLDALVQEGIRNYKEGKVEFRFV